MKKILLAMIAVLFVGTASAQFQVKEKQCLPEVVWQDAFRWVGFYQQDLGNNDYYYMFGLRTSNQFDDRLLIHLGRGNKTVSTLRQLLNELYSEGKIYELTDDKGEPFTLICKPFNIYHIYKKGYAGYAHIKLSQVETILSLFQ